MHMSLLFGVVVHRTGKRPVHAYAFLSGANVTSRTGDDGYHGRSYQSVTTVLVCCHALASHAGIYRKGLFPLV
jgi:hypothetical protein